MRQPRNSITLNNSISRATCFMCISIVFFVFASSLLITVQAATEKTPTFVRVPTQFIAALGDPTANSGVGAQSWGIWYLDPGPRGVRLGNYEKLKAAGGVAPAKWEFDSTDWWVEENGLLMEKPSFPVAPGKYMVTGDRKVVSVLTIHAEDDKGIQRWELSRDASLYDVTHLGCRSARYTPVNETTVCTPGKALDTVFPITPGRTMPSFDGCHKLDYAVLFVIAVEIIN